MGIYNYIDWINQTVGSGSSIALASAASIASVPEPSALWLLISAALALGIWRRRQ